MFSVPSPVACLLPKDAGRIRGTKIGISKDVGMILSRCLHTAPQILGAVTAKHGCQRRTPEKKPPTGPEKLRADHGSGFGV